MTTTMSSDHDISEGVSENDECTDHDSHPHHDLIEEREKDDNIEDENKEDRFTEMAESKLKTETDENGQLIKVGTATKLKLDPKDPLRPRRKKARRACFACQRAHLTCGDERPCQRCIKRGLADACQDGVRKKAKYLHDAPPEALRPVLGPNYKQNYNPVNSSRPSTTTNGQSMTQATSDTSSSNRVGGSLFQSEGASSYAPIFNNQQNTMPPPLQARLSISSNQQSPISSPFNRQESLQNINLPRIPNENRNSFDGAIFDPSNPALFNFDLEGLNFGNHYGALEFGMLGHMSSGMADISNKDQTGPLPLTPGIGIINFSDNSVYGNNLGHYNQLYPSDLVSFGNISENQAFSAQQGLPHAYAIATGSQSQYSPSIEDSPGASGATYENSPTDATYTPNSTPHNLPTPKSLKPTISSGTGSSGSTGRPGSGFNSRKRSRDSSFIYDIVQEPYSYTAGFHSLTAFLQRRFSATATLRIAKSLASIRPSFISCTKNLNRQDLIFMEKCFQRTLFEYEEFMYNCCTPTIVCRRTGEIAAVNQEFTLMTGWSKDVLLGKEPNLNVNTGKSTSENDSAMGRVNFSTSRGFPPNFGGIDQQSSKNSRLQPVLLAELLDDESVVEFYQDFARLAFNDSRGSVTTRCKLLKYCPELKEGDAKNQSPQALTNHCQSQEGTLNTNGKRKGDSGPGKVCDFGNRVREIDGKYGIERLERDGKLDCSYCWTMKRDVFDIPMLIVMNLALINQ